MFSKETDWGCQRQPSSNDLIYINQNSLIMLRFLTGIAQFQIKNRMFFKVSGTGKKRTLMSMWAAYQTPKKSCDPESQQEKTQEEHESLSETLEQETVEPSGKEETPGQKTKAQSGPASYRCSFKNEQSQKRPLITKGTHYWLCM